MEERVSTIKKIDLKKEDVHSMIMLDRSLSGADLSFLEKEFDFYQEDVNRFLSNYKSLAVVFNLSSIQEEFLTDWKLFIQKTIKRNDTGRFHNIFVNKKYDQVLLITNKRLLKVDLNILNEKIEDMNYRIESYNEKVKVEMDGLAEATKGQSGFFGKIIKLLEK
ncbi:MAG: hypothetical protein U9O94_06685 [Nanoarchaeota archaeon]|nr:hypothetical protein [Nanoarchaeota archaeon]